MPYDERILLFIRSRHDAPHRASALPEFAECGAVLLRAEPITEAQALVFLDDARCLDCFPGWGLHLARLHA